MPRPKTLRIEKDVLWDLLEEFVEDEPELDRLVEIFDADRVQRYLRIFDLHEEGEKD